MKAKLNVNDCIKGKTLNRIQISRNVILFLDTASLHIYKSGKDLCTGGTLNNNQTSFEKFWKVTVHNALGH